MSDYDNAIFRLATAQEAEPEDYTGEDGLLYYGSCHKPKEAYFPEGKSLFGRDRHPKECDCQRKRRETLEAADRGHKHREEVERLKRKGFTDPAMREWTFENDNGKCPQMHNAYSYVERWEQIKEENHGLILWGNVGTGKSYFAGCIANALMEREVSVCMTNFALILNDLAASFKDRNEYIARLCSFPLLILDDFGMERGTEYGLEQVYNVIDSRYRSGKPLIVTTNLTLEAAEKRIAELSAIFKRLYEDSVTGRISDERFTELSADYEAEQKELKEKAAALQGELSRTLEATANAEKFMKVVRKYTSFEELTPTLLREFVEKIVVHESEALDGKRRGKLRRQEIEIYYSFVGKVELPDT